MIFNTKHILTKFIRRFSKKHYIKLLHKRLETMPEEYKPDVWRDKE